MIWLLRVRSGWTLFLLSRNFHFFSFRYGAVEGGSTASFFATSPDPIYKTVFQFMSGKIMHFRQKESLTSYYYCSSGLHKSEVMLSSNSEGVEKVEDANGKYAFFMESASIEYLVERHCKLSQVIKYSSYDNKLMMILGWWTTR